MEQNAKQPFNVVFGQVMRAERLKKNWCLEAIKTATGIAETTLSQIERGMINITVNKMEKIVLALGFTLTEFFDKPEFKERTL